MEFAKSTRELISKAYERQEEEAICCNRYKLEIEALEKAFRSFNSLDVSIDCLGGKLHWCKDPYGSCFKQQCIVYESEGVKHLLYFADQGLVIKCYPYLEKLFSEVIKKR